MPQKPNIFIFTGIDTYSLEESLARQVSLFGEKYGEHNISRVDASDATTNWKSLESEVLSRGFLAEKRLFVVRNFVIKLRKTEENNESGDSENEADIHAREASLFHILESIPDDNFLILVSPQIPKTKKLYKHLSSLATIKTFETPYTRALWEKRFPDLETRIIQEVLWAYEARDNPKEPKPLSFDIHTTLEHIALYRKSHTQYTISDFISLEKEMLIFSFLDEVYAGNQEKARKSLHNILSYTNIYAFLWFLFTSLRNTLYIRALSHSMKASEIEKILKIHSFVVEKSLSTRVSEQKIREFFHKLIKANIAQKSGKWMYESELWLIFFIELGILGLQKS